MTIDDKMDNETDGDFGVKLYKAVSGRDPEKITELEHGLTRRTLDDWLEQPGTAKEIFLHYYDKAMAPVREWRNYALDFLKRQKDDLVNSLQYFVNPRYIKKDPSVVLSAVAYLITVGALAYFGESIARKEFLDHAADYSNNSLEHLKFVAKSGIIGGASMAIVPMLSGIGVSYCFNAIKYGARAATKALKIELTDALKVGAALTVVYSALIAGTIYKISKDSLAHPQQNPPAAQEQIHK